MKSSKKSAQSFAENCDEVTGKKVFSDTRSRMNGPDWPQDMTGAPCARADDDGCFWSVLARTVC
jgi:hypothetical protein